MNTYEHLIEVIDTDGSSFYAIKPGYSEADLTREEKTAMAFGTKASSKSNFQDFINIPFVLQDLIGDYLKKG